ncbi:MAG TPA: YceI family protein [Candidatus Acidoferrum sp.]|nr:YceI family protein [Candidatus Acidoferrum sp.]
MTTALQKPTLISVRLTTLSLLALSLFASTTQSQDTAAIPIFQVTPSESTIKFGVKASVSLEGTFEKWDATLAFTSPDVTTAVLNIRIQADSVQTGSGLKNGKLKGKDFFYAEQNPYITFVSDKLVQTGPNTFEFDGKFTIRGVTKPEKLLLTVSGKGTGHGVVVGTMAFDRKDYGIDKSIPFIKIADRVEVNVNLIANQLSGPRLVYKQ